MTALIVLHNPVSPERAYVCYCIVKEQLLFFHPCACNTYSDAHTLYYNLFWCPQNTMSMSCIPVSSNQLESVHGHGALPPVLPCVYAVPIFLKNLRWYINVVGPFSHPWPVVVFLRCLNLLMKSTENWTLSAARNGLYALALCRCCAPTHL